MSVPVERGRDAMSVSAAGQTPVGGDNNEFEVQFEELFRGKFRKLVGTALSLPGINVPEAKDAAEAALQETYKKWPTLTDPGAWVYKATISNVMKIKRKQAREARAIRKAQPNDSLPEAHEDPGLMQAEYQRWVMTILDSLPRAQREAVALYLVDELSPAEAAELLGKSPAALRRGLCAGREALRQQLADVSAPEPDASTIPTPQGEGKEVR